MSQLIININHQNMKERPPQQEGVSTKETNQQKEGRMVKQ
jgi:hypothetical protein